MGFASKLQSHGRPPYFPVMRARGLLFVVLAAGLLGIGVFAATAGEWVIAAAAAILGVWMGDLARRDLVR